MNSAARSLTDWPGIHEFGLAEDLAAGLLGGAAQADQGRVADGVDDGWLDVHGRIGGRLLGARKLCVREAGHQVRRRLSTADSEQKPSSARRPRRGMVDDRRG